VGVADVEDHGQPEALRRRELAAEGEALGVPRSEVAVIVQADLADRYHLRSLRHEEESSEGLVSVAAGLVGMDADRGPHRRMPGGERHRAAARLQVASHGDHGLHAGLGSPCQDAGEVLAQGVEMAMAVDPTHGRVLSFC
jgi:hypothetical protein